MSPWNTDTRYHLLYDIFPPPQKKCVWGREEEKNKGTGENTNQ